MYFVDVVQVSAITGQVFILPSGNPVAVWWQMQGGGRNSQDLSVVGITCGGICTSYYL